MHTWRKILLLKNHKGTKADMNSAFIQSTVLTSPMIGNCRKMISFVPDSDGYDGADDIQRTDGADFTVPLKRQ